jgi:hypothetical protein
MEAEHAALIGLRLSASLVVVVVVVVEQFCLVYGPPLARVCAAEGN